MPRNPAERLRAICLALPGAADIPVRRGPTYRIANKIFAMERPHGDAIAVWCKAPPGSQEVLIGADPKRFFVPPYVGPKGWIGIRLDPGTDWQEVATLIERSYRLIAPKRRRGR
jgi:predicted DNA-binding protein (MmcQ/YjbR family)